MTLPGSSGARPLTTTSRIQTHTIPLDFPRFDGTYPSGWICNAEQFFDYHHATADQRLLISSLHMDGEALQWYRWMCRHGEFSSWSELRKAFEIRFGPCTFEGQQRGTTSSVLMLQTPRTSTPINVVEDDLESDGVETGEDPPVWFFRDGLQEDLVDAPLLPVEIVQKPQEVAEATSLPVTVVKVDYEASRVPSLALIFFSTSIQNQETIIANECYGDAVDLLYKMKGRRTELNHLTLQGCGQAALRLFEEITGILADQWDPGGFPSIQFLVRARGKTSFRNLHSVLGLGNQALPHLSFVYFVSTVPACQLFDEMLNRNTVIWNTMVTGFGADQSMPSCHPRIRIEICERLSTMGIALNLLTYLHGTMHFPSSTLFDIVTDFMAMAFLLSLLGGFLANSFWGRYKTIVIFACVQTLGTGVLAMATKFQQLRPPPCDIIVATQNSKQANGFHIANGYSNRVIASDTNNYSSRFWLVIAQPSVNTQDVPRFVGFSLFVPTPKCRKLHGVVAIQLDPSGMQLACRLCPSLTLASLSPRRSLFHVHTLGSDSWRGMGETSFNIRYWSGSPWTYVNGALHWIAFSSCGPDNIVSFDIGDEEFRKMSFPLFGHQGFCSQLAVWEGFLCMISTLSDNYVKMWVMKYYGVRESWIKKFSISQLIVLGNCESLKAKQSTCSREPESACNIESILPTLPPSFTSLLASCCIEAEQDIPKVPKEIDVVTTIKRCMLDSSFNEMLIKVEKAISEMEGDLLKIVAMLQEYCVLKHGSCLWLDSCLLKCLTETCGMMLHEPFASDQVTLGSILSGCAQLGSLGLSVGRSLHGFMVTNKWELNVALETALLNLYAKRGFLKFEHLLGTSTLRTRLF